MKLTNTKLKTARDALFHWINQDESRMHSQEVRMFLTWLSMQIKE